LENNAVYEIIRKNKVPPEFACWITEAIYTLRISSTYVFFMEITVTRKLLSVTLYVSIFPVSMSDIPWKYPDKVTTTSFRVLSHLSSPVTWYPSIRRYIMLNNYAVTKNEKKYVL
jgi:hypothetical protein